MVIEVNNNNKNIDIYTLYHDNALHSDSEYYTDIIIIIFTLWCNTSPLYATLFMDISLWAVIEALYHG